MFIDENPIARRRFSSPIGRRGVNRLEGGADGRIHFEGVDVQNVPEVAIGQVRTRSKIMRRAISSRDRRSQQREQLVRDRDHYHELASQYLDENSQILLPDYLPSPFEQVNGCQRSVRECPEDAILYHLGIEAALKEFSTGTRPGVLDLGIGHGLPTLTLLRDGKIGYLCGVEVEPKSIRGLTYNARKLKVDQSKLDIIPGNFENQKIKTEVATLEDVDIVASNPPYLAFTPSTFPSSVRGGKDGCKYVPDLVLEMGEITGARVLVTNFTSVAAPYAVLDRVDDSPYDLSRCILLMSPLGFYTSKIANKIMSSPNTVYSIDSDGTVWQFIVSMVLTKSETRDQSTPCLTDSVRITLEMFHRQGVIIKPTQGHEDRMEIRHVKPDRMARLRKEFFGEKGKSDRQRKIS